jgi:hypothetical protein
MRQELRNFGGEIVLEKDPAIAPADHATRSKALDELLSRGATPALEQLAVAFETAADELERAGQAGFRRVRNTMDCWQWAQTIAWLEIEAAFMCALSGVLPAAVTACAILTASMGVYLVFYRMNC